MKYYGELTRQLYDSIEACEKAETEHKQKIDEAEAKKKALTETRAKRAKEIEELYKALTAAQEAYNKALAAFVKDYGSFHMTIRDSIPRFKFLDDWF